VTFVDYEVAAGAGLDYGSFGGRAQFGLGRGALLVQFHQRSFDDYRSPRETVDNSSSRDSGGLVRGVVPIGAGRIDLGLQINRARDLSRPTEEPDVSRTVYPLEDSDRLTLAYDLPGRGGFSRFELRAFAGRYRLITERVTVDTCTSTTCVSTCTSTTCVSRSDVRANDASLKLIAVRPGRRGLLRLGIDLVSRFGLQAEDRVEDHPSGGPPVVISDMKTIRDARRFDSALFVEGEHSPGSRAFSLSAGIRGDAVSTRNSGGSLGDRDTNQSAISGYAGMTWRAGAGIETTIQVSRGFRDPSLSDRYFQGTTGRGTIIGNPDLEPETTRQFDLAFRVQREQARFAAYGYLYRIHDLVERYESAPDMFAFRNRGEEEIFGLEVEWNVEIRPRLSARFTATYARGEILDDGSNPDDIPGDSLAISLLHRPGDRWWWQGRVRGVRSDNRPGPTERATPGYAVLDASVGFNLSEAFRIRLNLNNLTDKEYPSSPDSRSPLALGRSAALTLAGRF
ncbi:MAG: TonB-dependent receptor, partial [Acidobacteria bacterium]|nr:TonB-dependent receptor [Acidobacteriota bacterium]